MTDSPYAGLAKPNACSFDKPALNVGSCPVIVWRLGYSKYIMRILVATFALAACACGPSTRANGGGIPEYGYQVVHTYPHDRGAFTEGLLYQNGFLYESTGLNLESSLRKVKLETGEVVQKFDWPEAYFGEGIIKWHDKMYQLTYKNQIGFIFDFDTFAKKGEFQYQGQGWAFTTDGKQIYMDGSRDVQAEESDPEIRILDPENLMETGVIKVTAEGVPVKNLNELEWVKGEIYANIWQTYKIARIDPKTGEVVGWIDLTGILGPQDQQGANVLNGIAYDAQGDRLFVTGKNWPKLFEIKLVKIAR
jgi:glutaminyl-peptide cyclotransferase